MHQDVVDVILFAEPKRIVYVSCNPATQARDLQLLDVKYKVKAIQPVDMFPHTHHVENVVLLEKRCETEIKQKLKNTKNARRLLLKPKLPRKLRSSPSRQLKQRT